MKFVICLVSSLIVVLLLGCEKKSITPFDGNWSRTIKVPKTVQGRCFEEALTIEDDSWNLIVVLHSSFLCNQPTLELHYHGEIVSATKDSDNWKLAIEDIEIVSVVNITGMEKVMLPSSGVKKFHKKYVEGVGDTFSQTLHLAKPNLLMANLYPVALKMGIEEHPKPNSQLVYQFNN